MPAKLNSGGNSNQPRPLRPRPQQRGTDHRPTASAPLSGPGARGLFRSAPAMSTPFSAGELVDPLGVPLLSELNIEVQGPKKVGKSSIVAGDWRCRFLKLPEGSNLVRRAGKPGDPSWRNVWFCPTLEVLDRAIDETCEYAAKHGQNGDFNCIAIDSTKAWQGLIVNNLLRRHNERKAGDEGFEPAETLADLKMYGSPYEAVYQYMERRLALINSVGWGWRMISHYDMAVLYRDGKPTQEKEWRSECYPKIANLISPLADILMRCDKFTRESGGCSYIIDFSTVESDRMGSRLPMGLTGAIDVPDWDDPRTPVDYRAWSIVESQYTDGVRRWQAEQARYHGVTAQEGGQPG